MTPPRNGSATAQRMAALRKANRIRTARAAIKRALRSGHIAPELVLLHPPAALNTAQVRDVLVALPKIGSHRSHRVLRRSGVSPTRTVGTLTERERRLLLEEIAALGPAFADTARGVSS